MSDGAVADDRLRREAQQESHVHTLSSHKRET